MKRAKVVAPIRASKEQNGSPLKKWRNAKDVITGLHQVEDSDVSDDETAVAEKEDDDSDAEEARLRGREMSKARKDEGEMKLMESPVEPKQSDLMAVLP